MEKQYRMKYSSNVSDGEWALVVPHLTCVEAPQREHALRAVLAAFATSCAPSIGGVSCPATCRHGQGSISRRTGRRPHPKAMIVDSRTGQSTPESDAQAESDGAKRRKGLEGACGGTK